MATDTFPAGQRETTVRDVVGRLSWLDRFLPVWHDTIAPDIKAGKRVLIAAHGNSLRALVKYLDNMSEEEIVELNIPTGVPLVYLLNDNLKALVAEQTGRKPGGEVRRLERRGGPDSAGG